MMTRDVVMSGMMKSEHMMLRYRLRKLAMKLHRSPLKSVPFEIFRPAGRSVCDCVLSWMMFSVQLRKKLLILIFNVSEDL